jgi:hypothetical protein
MRAADVGCAPRFLGFFLALGFSCFDGESTLPPSASNANRSAATGARTVEALIELMDR